MARAVDTDFIEVEYRDAFELMEHLQGMGENNAGILARAAISKDLLVAMATAYHAMHAKPDGTVPATFQACCAVTHGRCRLPWLGVQ